MKGAYIIKNLRNGMVYIGSASCIEKRIEDHFRELDEGKHFNWRMQKDYKKDKRFFVWGVVVSIPVFYNREVAYDIEQDLLDKYADRYNILLNSRDHLLEDKTKREKSRQLKIKFSNGYKQ